MALGDYGITPLQHTGGVATFLNGGKRVRPYGVLEIMNSKGELVYFGEDSKRWPEMVIPGHVTRGDIPVLFTTAEWDNTRYLWPQAAVYQELVEKHKARPRYRQSLGHNHSSQLLSVGTPDTSVSRELVDFIERTVQH